MDIVISAITHRSGSTLLQRIFNHRDKTFIWGEHSGNSHTGIVTDFCDIRDKVMYSSVYSKQEREEFFADQRKGAVWIANMTPEKQYVDAAIMQAVRSFFGELYGWTGPDYDMIGFKEVRYGERELLLLQECYPNINLVLLVRNPIDIWNSIPSDWPFSIEQFADTWVQRAQFYFDYSKQNPNIFLFKYEDIVQRRSATLNTLAEVSRVPINQIVDVLNYRMNSTKSKKPESDAQFLVTRCKNTMEIYKYL